VHQVIIGPLAVLLVPVAQVKPPYWLTLELLIDVIGIHDIHSPFTYVIVTKRSMNAALCYRKRDEAIISAYRDLFKPEDVITMSWHTITMPEW
jgi:hypothetical protein